MEAMKNRILDVMNWIVDERTPNERVINEHFIVI